MRTVLLTSTEKRHQYIAKCLEGQTDLQLIITEEKSGNIRDTSGLNETDKKFLNEHFKAREATETTYFGKVNFPSTVLLLRLAHGEINSQLSLEVLQDIDPEIIVLFGTSIISEELLQAFPNRFVNLHLGLSPYFRGSATNLFPIFHQKPQCIGATIHLATKKVDAGAILHQLRPEININDGLHDIGNKVILKAGRLLPEILDEYICGKLEPIKQESNGELCRVKDLSPEVLREIYNHIENGLIVNYLKNKEEIDFKYPIIEQI